MEFNARSQEDQHGLIERVNRIDGILETAVSVRLELVKNRYDREK